MRKELNPIEMQQEKIHRKRKFIGKMGVLETELSVQICIT
jgi:hypothetical protein